MTKERPSRTKGDSNRHKMGLLCRAPGWGPPPPPTPRAGCNRQRAIGRDADGMWC